MEILIKYEHDSNNSIALLHRLSNQSIAVLYSFLSIKLTPLLTLILLYYFQDTKVDSKNVSNQYILFKITKSFNIFQHFQEFPIIFQII